MSNSKEAYWKSWPSGGHYVNDLKWSQGIATKYLKEIHKRGIRNGCVVFDADETLIFGDPDEMIGVREMELGEHGGQSVFILPPNNQIVNIAKVAQNLGYKIIVLTARPMGSRLATQTNMDMFKIPYNMILMNSKDEDPEFKIRIRRQLSKNHNILLTVGDQPCDVLLPGKSAVLKLPDPESLGAYFYPGKI